MVMVYLFDVLFVWFLFVKFWVCLGAFLGGGFFFLVFPPFFVSFFVFVYIRGGGRIQKSLLPISFIIRQGLDSL